MKKEETEETIVLTLTTSIVKDLQKIAVWEERSTEGMIKYLIKNHINHYVAPRTNEG